MLNASAPRRSRWTLAPTWHRLRTPEDVAHLDNGLEGWEETRRSARRPFAASQLMPALGASHWDGGETLADRFRAHAGNSQHLYGYAMRGLADDWEAGGPTRLVCRGYENAPRGAVIQLRLLAGVFRLVLTDQAPELRPYYPCLGGD